MVIDAPEDSPNFTELVKVKSPCYVPDGTVGTLLNAGTLEIVDIPPAPSAHYWHAGKWNGPKPDQLDEV